MVLSFEFEDIAIIVVAEFAPFAKALSSFTAPGTAGKGKWSSLLVYSFCLQPVRFVRSCFSWSVHWER